jgi:hypothetical protein
MTVTVLGGDTLGMIFWVTGQVAPISIKKGHFSPTPHHFFRPMPSIELKKWLDWSKTVCFFDSKPLT